MAAKSLALIVDDPDAPDPKAPQVTWVHWVLFDIAPDASSLPEGGRPFPGRARWVNDWKRYGYGGPCPPIGRHRYFFKLLRRTRPHSPAEAEQGRTGAGDAGACP